MKQGLTSKENDICGSQLGKIICITGVLGLKSGLNNACTILQSIEFVNEIHFSSVSSFLLMVHEVHCM
jgi:hypothetical protein